MKNHLNWFWQLLTKTWFWFLCIRLILMHCQCKMFPNINQSDIIIYVTFEMAIAKDNTWLNDYVKIFYTNSVSKLNPLCNSAIVYFCMIIWQNIFICQTCRILILSLDSKIWQMGFESMYKLFSFDLSLKYHLPSLCSLSYSMQLKRIICSHLISMFHG